MAAAASSSLTQADKQAELSNLRDVADASAAFLTHIEAMDAKFDSLSGQSTQVRTVLEAWSEVFQMIGEKSVHGASFHVIDNDRVDGKRNEASEAAGAR